MTLPLGIIPHLASEEAAPADTAQWIQFDQWQPMNLASSYYSAYIDQEAKRGQRLSFWFDANFQGTDSVIHLQGNPGQLKRVAPAFDAKIITNYEQDLGGNKHPIISRSSATKLRDGTLVVLAAIDPLTAVETLNCSRRFLSKNREKEMATPRPPRGEPSAWLAKMRQQNKKIRSDGGSIIELPDGRLRMYTQPTARVSVWPRQIASMANGSLFAPNPGRLRICARACPAGHGYFPKWSPWVMQAIYSPVVTRGPPREIWGAVSQDGLNFVVPQHGDNQEQKPLLVPQQLHPNVTSFKALRFAYDAKREKLFAIANPWNAQNAWPPLMWTDARIDLGIFAAND